MNIKFQCRDPWLVTPRVRPPGRCFFRPSTAAAGSTRPPSRGLQAARLPQASALLTATSRLKKALLRPHSPGPRLWHAPEDGTDPFASSRSALGSVLVPRRHLRLGTPSEA